MNKDKKPAAHRATIGLRNRIRQLFAKTKDYQKVMDETGCTYWQAYNAVNFRVKLDRSSRADKGLSRAHPEKNKIVMPSKAPDEFKSLEDFLEYKLAFIANKLGKVSTDVGSEIKIIKEISSIKKDLDARRLESWIKRPEAILIIRIMKRLNPKLTEDEIQKIYREEYEKVQRDLA